jgi:Polysaccharide deacetylase
MFDLTLTFDNGPDPETTPFVLDVLARQSLRTTFFVVGHKLSTLEGGCSIFSSSMCCRRSGCLAYCGTPFRREGWVDRALAQCRLQAWTVMVLHDVRLALCAT